MNRDETRLKEIQDFKKFYKIKINEAERELEKDLLQVQLNKLSEEEHDILRRCNAL